MYFCNKTEAFSQKSSVISLSTVHMYSMYTVTLESSHNCYLNNTPSWCLSKMLINYSSDPTVSYPSVTGHSLQSSELFVLLSLGSDGCDKPSTKALNQLSRQQWNQSQVQVAAQRHWCPRQQASDVSILFTTFVF